MATKIQGYSIEEILVGTYYRSTQRYGLDGLIVQADKRDDVWVSGGNAYAVRVRPEYSGGIFNEFWATIAVDV